MANDPHWMEHASERMKEKGTVGSFGKATPKKIARAKKALSASTETETIVRALDLVIAEANRNRIVAEANSRFLKSGIRIRDVFGSLAE